MTLTANTEKIAVQEPRDFGQALAAEYWRNTAHVFSHQGPEKPDCGLCLRSDHGQHKALEPYGPRPTITSVVNDARPPYYHFTATLSCGHGPVGFATTPDHAPTVGSAYDCWDCQRPVDDRNHPGLPEELREQIEAAQPRCPECRGAITSIPFIKHTIHAYQADVDFQTGEIAAGSEHEDTLDERPEWSKQTAWGTFAMGEILVQCAEKHEWKETRLAYRYRSGEHQWIVLPPIEEAQS